MRKASALFFLALVFLLIVLADLIRWFIITGNAPDVEQARQVYLAYYPAELQSIRLLTVISLLLLTFSGFVFLNAAKTRSTKAVASVLGMVCALLMMWKIFGFMKGS